MTAFIHRAEGVGVVSRPARTRRYLVMERRDVREAVEFEAPLVAGVFALNAILLGWQSAVYVAASVAAIVAMGLLYAWWRAGGRRHPHPIAFLIGVVIVVMGVVSTSTTLVVAILMCGLFGVVVVGCAAWMPWSARWHSAFLVTMTTGFVIGLAFGPRDEAFITAGLLIGLAAVCSSVAGAWLVRLRRQRAHTATLDLMGERAELRRTIRRLEEAQGRIRRLEGILPICSSCKQIRDGDDWQRLEAYLMEHSDAQFSHGICPDCAGMLYGDLASA